jgi:hypothetical protein
VISHLCAIDAWTFLVARSLGFMQRTPMTRIALVSLFAAACSNNNNNTAIDAAPAHDASHDASQDASRDAPSSPDAPSGSHGQVAVVEMTLQGAVMSGVSANMSDAPVFGTVVGTDGPCTMYHDNQGSQISAGTINVTGTTTAITLNPLGTPPNVHYSPSPTPPTDLYTDGATISVQAAGGDVAAFSGTVTAPTALAGFTLPTTMSRAGYTATWTAGTGQQVWVILGTLVGDNMICRVDDTGSFAVPASTFALVPATVDMIVAGLARVSEDDIATPDVQVFAASEVASGLIPLTQ